MNKSPLHLALPGLAFLLGASCVEPAHAEPAAFVPVMAQSSLSFVGKQQGEKFTGALKDFDARIAYAPEQVSDTRIDVTVRMKALTTGNQERDTTLAGADWFDYQHFPTATFRASAFRAAPGGATGDAELTIKGHAKHIPFPFTWKASDTGATLDARVTLDRLDFGLGSGEWTDESIVEHKVEVIVHLVLVRAGPSAVPPAAARKN